MKALESSLVERAVRDPVVDQGRQELRARAARAGALPAPPATTRCTRACGSRGRSRCSRSRSAPSRSAARRSCWRRRPARPATGTLTVGSLLVVIAYLAAVYNPLSSIAHTTGSLQQAVVSARRVREIFALTPEPFDAPGGARRRRRSPATSASSTSASPTTTAADSAGRQLRGASGRAGGARRPDRRRQDDAGQPAAAVLRADRRPRAHRRRGRARLRPAVAARAHRARAAGAGALCRHDRRQHPLRPARRQPTPTSRPRRAPRTSTSSSSGCRNGYETPVAEAGATLSGGERQRLGHRAGAAEGRADPDPRRADVVARRASPRKSSSTRCAGSATAARRSSSPTACRRFATPTASWCCTTAA